MNDFQWGIIAGLAIYAVGFVATCMYHNIMIIFHDPKLKTITIKSFFFPYPVDAVHRYHYNPLIATGALWPIYWLFILCVVICYVIRDVCDAITNGLTKISCTALSIFKFIGNVRIYVKKEE